MSSRCSPLRDSKELISKIHVPQNQLVKKGTPLYEYDPRPNQYALDQLTAQLDASQQGNILNFKPLSRWQPPRLKG